MGLWCRARFEWPTLPRPDLDRAGQYYVGRCGNAVRVAPAPRAPPQRPGAVPRIRCATVRAAAPCVLAARGAPTSVPVARAARRWAPGLSIARAASRSPAVHGVIDTISSTHTSPSARGCPLAPHHNTSSYTSTLLAGGAAGRGVPVSHPGQRWSAPGTKWPHQQSSHTRCAVGAPYFCMHFPGLR